MFNEILYNNIVETFVFWDYPYLEMRVTFTDSKDLQEYFNNKMRPIVNTMSMLRYYSYHNKRYLNKNVIIIDISRLDNEFFKKALISYIGE